jgi:hypothetical protein
VYPAPAALAFAPLALLPLPLASSLYTVLSLAALAGALLCLDVRDWRCYAAALSSLPVMQGVMLGTVSPFLLLGAAALWRWRNRPLVAGALLAALVVTKLFLWPLGFWLLATRRFRATAWSVVVAAGAATAGWAAIGFAGLREYPSLMHALTSLVGAQGYSPYALVLALGGPAAAATAGMLVAGGALAAGAVASRCDERAFLLAVAAAFALSPVVWAHYLVLLYVPIALASRRLSPLWLAPLPLWFFASSWSDGRLERIIPTLLIGAVVVYVSSSVRIVRVPIRSMRITTRSSGSGQHTSESCSSQSDSASLRCLAGRSGSTADSAYMQKCLPGGIRIRDDSVTSK